MAERIGFLGSAAMLIAPLAAGVLGLSAGAMLAEAAVLVPYWRSLPAGDFLDWYRDNASLLFDFFAPLEIAGAVLAIVAAVVGRGGPRTLLLVASAVLAVAILAAFPLYFEAVNESFAAGTIASDRVPEELARWARWHGVRTAMGIGAFAAAILAIRG